MFKTHKNVAFCFVFKSSNACTLSLIHIYTRAYRKLCYLKLNNMIGHYENGILYAYVLHPQLEEEPTDHPLFKICVLFKPIGHKD